MWTFIYKTHGQVSWVNCYYFKGIQLPVAALFRTALLKNYDPIRYKGLYITMQCAV